jgi:hypothetical protein
MKMAIVSWQPGPNRIIQLPTEVRGFTKPLLAKKSKKALCITILKALLA